MFWVTMAGMLPLLYSEASARWPRPGRAAAKVGSIAKRRRHASSRASWLATNSSNGIGRLRVHNPPGERKSGIPHSVEIPAPVKGIMVEGSAIMSPSCSTPLRRSDAITELSEGLAALIIARPVGLLSHCPGIVAKIVGRPPNIWPQSGRVCDRLRHLRVRVDRFVVLLLVILLVVALLCFWCRSCGYRFLPLAVLGKSFDFGFKLGVPRRELFRQLFDCPVAQLRKFFDVE